MIALLGRLAVAAALLCGVAGAISGWAAGRTVARPAARRWAFGCAWAFAAAMGLAVGLLWAALLLDDFSVSYAAKVGSVRAPAWVSVASLWAALEGSLLFWGALLAGAVALFARARRRDEGAESATALSVLLAAGAGFAFLVAWPASPFRDVFPAPPDGGGPNPLLQNHPLMAIHPPALYLGFVGMTVPFALAAASLRAGVLDRERIATLRRWLLAAWICLTAGIALGGRWAYDVLGWGGYWAWDPVENASLLPWLVATAALHALRLSERRPSQKAWALALVMIAFLLTWLGTFLTRSGVVSSVHSFSPSAAGPSLLALLGAALVFTVVLLGTRAGRLDVDGATTSLPPPRGSGRSLALAANNVVLVVLTLVVLAGTLWPVAARALFGARVTVGEGFFEGSAGPLGLALLFLMGIGPALPWGSVGLRQALPKLVWRAAAGALALAVALALGARGAGLLAVAGLGGFAAAGALEGLLRPLAVALKRAGRAPAAIGRVLVEGRRRSGGHLAHLGVAFLIVAVTASSAGQVVREHTLGVGQQVEIGAYRVLFRGAQRRQQPHRELLTARFEVFRDGRRLGELAPQLSRYRSTGEALGTPAVRSSPIEDLYLMLVSIDPARGEVGLRVQVAPMVAWIWVAAALVALGGLLALPLPARRRLLRRRPAEGGASRPTPAPREPEDVRA